MTGSKLYFAVGNWLVWLTITSLHGLLPAMLTLGVGRHFFAHIMSTAPLHFKTYALQRAASVAFEMMATYQVFLYSYILFLKQHYRTIIFGPQDDRCYAATGLPTFSFGVVVAWRRLISLRPVDMRLPCFRQWLHNVLIMDTLHVWLKLSRSSIRSSVTWLYHRPNKVERAWVGGLGGW